MIDIAQGDTCQYSHGCDYQATDLVYSRHLQKVMKLCLVHAEIVVDEASPEYVAVCMNCHCRLPIN